MKTFTRRTASVSYEAVGRIGVAHIGGFVTEAVAGGVIGEIKSLSADACATAQVVIYQAQVLMTPDHLFAAAQGSGRDKLPTALVVDMGQISMFRDYARMCMQAGALKAAFLTVEQAMEWVVQAELVQAYRLSRGLPNQSMLTSSQTTRRALPAAQLFGPGLNQMP